MALCGLRNAGKGCSLDRRHGSMSLAVAVPLVRGASAEMFLGESRGSTKINDKPTKFFTTGDIPERPALLMELGR